jgi:hypothetical protein
MSIVAKHFNDCEPMSSSWMWRYFFPLRISLQTPVDAGYPLPDFSTPKMEAMHSSETSVYLPSTQRHIPEDDTVHSDRCENLKSSMVIFSRGFV